MTTLAYALNDKPVTDAAPSWLCGIPHLTKQPCGRVYWRNTTEVAHFSFSDRDHQLELRASQELSDKCMALEENGVGVTARSVALKPCYEAPVDTPWLTALRTYDSFFQFGEIVIGLFGHATGNYADCMLIESTRDGIKATHYIHKRVARDTLLISGYTPIPQPRTYVHLHRVLQRMRVTDLELKSHLSRSFLN